MAGPVDGRFLRVSVRAIAVIWALVALSVGVGSVVGLTRALLLGALVVLGLLLMVGVSVRYVNHRRFPPVHFTPVDVAEIEGVIESARTRLASGDSAAFAVYPTVEESGDATGQIWLFGDDDGHLGTVSLELALPASVLEPDRHPDLARLLAGGWEIQSARPGEWVLLTRSDMTSALGLVSLVVGALAGLFDLPPDSGWAGRATA